MKIAVAMSGGVDSSVAALILRNQGHEVVGFTMHNFSGKEFHFNDNEGPDVAVGDAISVCNKLGIKHKTIFLHDDFKKNVIEYFINEYNNGKTPNPCTICNPIIKWGKFLEAVNKEFSFEKYATGHFAKIRENDGLFSILKSTDDRKDQTYMLWGLTQNQIKKTLFPLAKYSKSEIRKLAEEAGLDIALKKDSQEICFIKTNYKEFLNEKLEIKSGDILFKDGRKIGSHNGFPYYTIGQRRWINIPWKSPLYVQRIDTKNNLIVVTDEPKDLLTDTFYLKDINWISGFFEDLSESEIQIRYNSKSKEIKKFNFKCFFMVYG